MEIYLVGGAVRDELLNTKNKDRDWVVVNARPEQLLAQGYQQVGKEFPVFLHPQSREEYALATGLNRTWGAHVSLQDDLKRRDLTMNAIAKTQQGVYIDPFHGRRTGYEHAAYAQKPALNGCLQRLLAMNMKAIVGDKQPHDIKATVHQMRVALTAQIQKNWE